MTAKSNLFALVLAAAICQIQPASAQQPLAAAQEKVCMDLAQLPVNAVTEKLMLFAGDVLGKNAELWQESDFQALLANARVCDGKPAGVEPAVSFAQWNVALTAVYPMVRKVTDLSVPIVEKYRSVFPVEGGIVLCTRLFDFRKDPVWLWNNSAEIFGRPFERMTPEQLAAARDLISECKPVLVQVLKARRLDEGDAEKLVKSMNISIDRDQKIPLVQIENLVSELVPKRDGKPIPLAYVSPNTLSVIRRVNSSLLRKVRLQTDDMVMISKWADSVFDLVPAGPDRAYAEVIKNAVTKEMFPG
jgi:hypothetical protein